MHRILVIDDNATYLEFICHVLKQYGFDTFGVTDGNLAEDAIHSYHPDLILLDHYLAGMTGLELYKKMKEHPVLRDIPVIFLSGRAENRIRIEGLDLGGVDYIEKSTNMEEIVARIRNQLTIHALNQELIRANKDLIEKQERVSESLRSAAAIQKALLPKKLPDWPEFSYAWLFKPCEQVGGDIFNIQKLSDDYVCVYMVDVSGHGFPSSMLTVSVSQSLHPHNVQMASADPKMPGEVLRMLDQEYPFERFEQYFSIVYLLIERRTGSCTMSLAAHPPPILQRKGSAPAFIEKGGSIIGFGKYAGYDDEVLRFETGDRLWLYTDGVYELENKEGEMFGRRRLLTLFEESKTRTLDQTVKDLEQVLEDFRNGASARDDITLLGIEYQGGAYAN